MPEQMLLSAHDKCSSMCGKTHSIETIHVWMDIWMKNISSEPLGPIASVCICFCFTCLSANRKHLIHVMHLIMAIIWSYQFDLLCNMNNIYISENITTICIFINVCIFFYHHWLQTISNWIWIIRVAIGQSYMGLCTYTYLLVVENRFPYTELYGYSCMRLLLCEHWYWYILCEFVSSTGIVVVQQVPKCCTDIFASKHT